MAKVKNLQDELLEIAGASNLMDALVKLKVCTPTITQSVQISGDSGWYRGGCETYVRRFHVSTEDGIVDRELLLKACVAYSPSASVVQTVAETWLHRRVLLEKEGAQVPRLYGYANAVFLEEFIPDEFLELIIRIPMSKQDPHQKTLGFQVGWLAGKLSLLGFAPISLLSDLRVSDKGIVLVDFGEDLGPPYMAASNQSLEEILRASRKSNSHLVSFLRLFQDDLNQGFMSAQQTIRQ